LLKINPDNIEQYEMNGEWVPFSTKTYSIPVKGQDSVLFVEKFTPFGRVIADRGEVYAQRWHAMEGENRSVLTFDALAKAVDWRTFNNALKQFCYPPQNFVYADTAGNVGLHCAGKLPMKPAYWDGGVLDGTLPPDTVFVPYQFLPHHYKPEQGYSYSANQVAAQADYYIGTEWAEIYRARRINDVLQTTEVYTVEDMKALQNDRIDLMSEDLKAVLEKYSNASEDWRFVAPLIAWNGSSQASDQEPLLARYFLEAIYANFDQMLQANYDVHQLPPVSNTLRYLLENDTIAWAETTIPTYEFLLMSCDDASQKFKADITNYEMMNYGLLTHFEMNHLFRLPGFGRSIPNLGGSGNTPNVNGENTAGPSMRTIIEMRNGVRAQMVLAGGQSGRINSRWYDNQIVAWRDGVYFRAPFESSAATLDGIALHLIFTP